MMIDQMLNVWYHHPLSVTAEIKTTILLDGSSAEKESAS